ncbi:MAG: MBL fold metallo-hydrolase [Christensenellales bacterium]|jgi:L-ascorbate metabolism protein UlaG (beta-lactamase superfamily)
MKVQWLGHSCFCLTTENGTRIIADPFKDSIGYPLANAPADIVTTSHKHYDHGYTQAVMPPFTLVDTPEKVILRGVTIYGVPTWHDEAGGSLRGDNIVFVYEADGLRLAHMGDLGHLLSAEQLAAIGRLDVLMIPIGGIYTIDAQVAAQTVKALSPRVVLPMHYQSDRLTLGKKLGGLEDFLSLAGKGIFLDTDTLQIEPGDGLRGICVPKFLDK